MILKSREASEVIVKREEDLSCGQSERGILGKGIFQVVTVSRVGPWQFGREREMNIGDEKSGS